MADESTGYVPLSEEAAVAQLLTPAEDILMDIPSEDEVTAEDKTEAEVTAVTTDKAQSDLVIGEDASEEEAPPEEEEEEAPEADEEEAEEETQEEETEEATEAEEEEEEAVEPDEVLHTMPDGTELTLKELKQGNLRNADYTQKTQALAEERQVLSTEKQQVGQERQALAEALMMSMNIVEPQLVKGAQTDWQALHQEDAYAYAEQWAEFQQAQVRWGQLQSNGQELTQQQAQQDGAKRAAYEATEAKALHLALPELADPTKAKALQGQLRDYALASGLSDTEVTSIKDHRIVVMLDKARKYDEMMTAGKTVAKKKLKKAPTKMLKKGQPVTKAEKTATARSNQLAKIRRTGDEDLLAEWLLSGT